MNTNHRRAAQAHRISLITVARGVFEQKLERRLLPLTRPLHPGIRLCTNARRIIRHWIWSEIPGHQSPPLIYC